MNFSPEKYPRILLPADNKPIESLGEYQKRGGFKGLEKARTMSSQEMVAFVKQAGLRGRGGAGFPTGIKWETLLSDPCPVKYVVCNAAEGEPGTYKDRYLLGKNPYVLLEGILIACHMLKPKSAVIGIKAKFKVPLARLKEAIREMESAGLLEPGYIEIFEGPNDYLFGEEKGLVETIDGNGALPRVLPPFIQGIRFTPTSPNPTLVNNVETLSHLPQIFAKGVEWFRSIGSGDTPGTTIISLSGDVKRPGMYELPMGTPLRELLYDIGGGPVGNHPFKAVFSGVASAVITPDMFDTPLDFGSMRKAGSGLGSGGLFVYDASVCMVRAALLLGQFLGDSSCGQCMPCVKGTNFMADTLRKIEEGRGSPEDIENIILESGRCNSQTRCFLPTQTGSVVSSVIRKFPKEFEAHFKSPCRNTRTLVLPKIEDFDETTATFTYEKGNVLQPAAQR